LIESTEDGASISLVYEAPKEIAKYIAGKGSVCIDGISLTVNEVSGQKFTVNVIPHTQTETIIGDYKAGQNVNLEVDIIARYLERLLQGANSSEGELSKSFLSKHGFD